MKNKVLVVTSGKGGVGKTTTTAALGAALALAGKKVAVIDFDVGLRNLDLVMGAERRVVFDLINVVQGVAKLSQAIIRDKRIETLWLLPASQTRDKDALTEAGVASVINELRGTFDWAAWRAWRRALCRRQSDLLGILREEILTWITTTSLCAWIAALRCRRSSSRSKFR